MLGLYNKWWNCFKKNLLASQASIGKVCEDACYKHGMIRRLNCSGDPFRRSLRPTAEELEARLDARIQKKGIAAGNSSGKSNRTTPSIANVAPPAHGRAGSSGLILATSDMAERSGGLAKAGALLMMAHMSGLLRPLTRRLFSRAVTLPTRKVTVRAR